MTRWQSNCSDINDGLWEGLKSVEELDIGWNEIKQVPGKAKKLETRKDANF